MDPLDFNMKQSKLPGSGSGGEAARQLIEDLHHPAPAPLPIEAPVATGVAVIDPPASSSEWFETVYRDAQGELGKVRWAEGRANPMMVAGLNNAAPGLVRPGSRAVVVGCGLGDDVAELVARGYDAVGFDVSPTAISWARKRFPDYASLFSVADLFALPAKFSRRFDLVVEIYTIQALGVAQRPAAAKAVASLVGPQGHVLTICRGRDSSELLETVQGPPWPLCSEELVGLMELSGLRPLHGLDDFHDDETPPQRRLRGVFVKA